MKNRIYTSVNCIRLCFLLLPQLISSCLFEHAELTPNGEKGVDPTEVNVTAEIKMNIKISDLEQLRAVTRSGETPYIHRFIIEAYLDMQPVARQVVYEDISNQNRVTVSVPMKLHARNYQLVVWADYVDENEEADLYYDTSNLKNIISTDPYQGNAEYRDVFYSCHNLNLTKYRNEWNAKVPVEINLVRPMAKYELIATDVALFLQKIKDGTISGKKFKATVKYNYYLPVGFNTLDGTPGHSLMYMQYAKSFSVPAEGTTTLPVGLDYIFVNGPGSFVTVTVEITNENAKVVARTANLKIPYEQNHKTTVSGNFLTADPNSGININTDYEGEINIDLDNI